MSDSFGPIGARCLLTRSRMSIAMREMRSAGLGMTTGSLKKIIIPYSVAFEAFKCSLVGKDEYSHLGMILANNPITSSGFEVSA